MGRDIREDARSAPRFGLLQLRWGGCGRTDEKAARYACFGCCAVRNFMLLRLSSPRGDRAQQITDLWCLALLHAAPDDPIWHTGRELDGAI